jgi:DNA-binding MarR family transcriptional regulator
MAAKRLALDDFIPYRLSVTSNLVSDSIARTYESLFGLTIPEWRLVAVIAETGGVTQQAIGAKTLMDKVTVSRAAIALVDRGSN